MLCVCGIAPLGSELRRLGASTGVFLFARFSPDGKTIVSAGGGVRGLRLWDVASERELLRFDNSHDCSFPAFSPDGKTLVATTDHAIGVNENDAVRVWDVATGDVLGELIGHSDEVRSAVFSPDGRTILSASEDGTFRMWNLFGGAEPRLLKGHSGGVWSAKYSSDGNTVISAGVDGTVRLWSVATGQELVRLQVSEYPVLYATLSPDGKTVLSLGSDEDFLLWDATTGTKLRSLRGPCGRPTSAAFSPDGSRVIVAASVGTYPTEVCLFDTTTGRQLDGLGQLAVSTPNDAAFSPDGKSIATAGSSKSAWLWNAATGDKMQSLSGHTGESPFGSLQPGREYCYDG